jgi:pyrroloquinoline quinone biosynthesis protein B
VKLRILNSGAASGAPWHGAVAVAAAGRAPWLLLNLSGGVASRLEAEPGLAEVSRQVGGGQSVVLTDAQIDQVAGLISLRNAEDIHLYTTPSVFEELTTTLPVLPELQRHCDVHWHMLPVAGDRRSAGFEVRGQASVAFTAIDTGQPPAQCVGESAADGIDAAGTARLDRPAMDRLPRRTAGQSIAIAMHDRLSGGRALFVRGLGVTALAAAGVLEGVQCLLVDPGTPLDPPALDRLTAWMALLPVPRKLLLGSHQAQPQDRARWNTVEPGVDGLEIVL